MIEFETVFVDTAPFIYFIEKDSNNPQYYEKMRSFFKYGYDNDKRLVSSVITMEEYFVFPYRNKMYEFINMFERLVMVADIEIVEISQEIAKKPPGSGQSIRTLNPWTLYSLQLHVCLDAIYFLQMISS